MNFFERQAATRRASRHWVVLFILAVIAVVAAVDAVVAIAFSIYLRSETDAVGRAADIDLRSVVFWTSMSVLAIIGCAMLYKRVALRAGGSAVALASGGRRIVRSTPVATEKRLLNIVEEMAIASGVPMPEVYVLDGEEGINAFAAGHAPADAAIAVTRGALDALSRSELQGVIAHEFSHLLNGDMRLNIRLMGLLFGILVIAAIGRTILRHGPRGGGKKGGAGAIVLIALAIMVIGYVGLFFGRLIQAAVARNRESLADASAVQFTRDPLGLRGALVKIGASLPGSRLREAQTDQIAHMLFAPGIDGGFRTHPPLIERIRAIDPGFRESEIAETRRKMIAAAKEGKATQVESPESSARERMETLVRGAIGGAVAAGASIAIAPQAVAAMVGNPSPAQIETAHTLFNSLPEEIVQAGDAVESAQGLFFALALDEDLETQTRQLKFIGVQLGEQVAVEVQKWLPRIRALNAAQKQPALLRLFPALRQLNATDRSKLLVSLTGMLQREGRIGVEKYALRKLAQLHLRESLVAPPLPGRATLDVHARELGLLFSVLAQAGANDPQAARLAYESGMRSLLPRERPEFSAPANWAPALDLAFAKLDRLLPAAKELLVQGLVRTIAHDGKLTVQEAEFLRTICATLHCPLPPLMAPAA